MKKLLLLGLNLTAVLTSFSQSISHVTVAGAMPKTALANSVNNSRMTWYSNNGGTGTSKEIYLNLTGVSNGDSLIVIGNNSDFKARIASKSLTWMNVISQTVANVNNTGGTSVQRGFGLSSGDTSVSLEIRTDNTSSTGSNEIYVLYKPSGSSVNTTQYLRLFPETVAKSNIYRWVGTTSASFHTASNWSPARTTPSTSDVLIFDHVGIKPVEILYNSGQFTQTVEQIMVTCNTQAHWINYRGSNGAQAKSTLKINSGNQLERFEYYWDQTLGEDKNQTYSYGSGDFDMSSGANLIIAGTDTIQLEFNTDAYFSNAMYCEFRTTNDYGNGACLKLFANSNLKHNDQQYYNVCGFKPELNTSICFASTGKRYSIHHIEDFGWGTSGILGGEGRVVIEAGTSVHFQTGDGGAITLGGILEVYGSLFASIKSNAPASSSASDWKNWVPYLQIKNDATRRGYIDTLGEYWNANRIEGGVQWELYNSGIRSWRTVGFPLKNEMNVSQISNNIVITGTKNSTNQDSFYSFNSTCATCKSSLLTWDEPNSEWSAYESGSTASTVAPGKGVLLFFRGMGSNGVGDPSSSANAGTMIFKGEINYGDFSLSNLNYNSNGGSLKGINLVANPYPAAIDWRTVIGNGNNSNIADKFYYFNPKAQNYSVYNNITGTLTLSGSTAYTNSSNDEAATIEQGAGFFVVATNSSNSLNFTEHCKTNIKGKTSAFKEERTIPCNQLSMTINYNSLSSNREDNSILEWDMSKFGSTHTEDATDQSKLFAGYLGIGTVDQNNLWYAIDRRPDLTEDVLYSFPMIVKTIEHTDYKISFAACSDLGNTEIQILDKLTNKSTPVKNSTNYVFSTTSSDALTPDKRFEILVQKKSGFASNSNVSKKFCYVYPNPTATKSFQISNLNENNRILGVRVYSLLATEVYSTQTILSNSIQLSDSVSAGSYFVEILTQNGTQVESLIIQ